MTDKQRLFPYRPSFSSHKGRAIIYWLIAISFWPLTLAIVLMRLAKRITKPHLRYTAFVAIIILTIFNGVVWAAMYVATSTTSAPSSTSHVASHTNPIATIDQPSTSNTTVVPPATNTTLPQQPQSTSTFVPSSATCDTNLWNHVYHAYRLKMLQPCVSITGTIDHLIHEKDGDTHVRLKLDSAYTSMLNDKNIADQYGDLVLEPVCEETPTQTDAISACSGYRSDVVVPAVGSHVSVTGSYVLDTDHGWNEIHPVTSITPVP